MFGDGIVTVISSFSFQVVANAGGENRTASANKKTKDVAILMIRDWNICLLSEAGETEVAFSIVPYFHTNMSVC